MARQHASILSIASVLILLMGMASVAPRAWGQRRRAETRPVLIGLMHPQSLWVVGAYDAKRGWLNDRRSYSLFRRGMRIPLFTETGPAGTVTLGKVEDGDVLGGYFARTRERVKATPAAALFGAARPVVSRPLKQSLVNPLYQKATAGPLQGAGLTILSARLTQHLRVDLNGDGVDEVLLGAHSRPGIGSDLRASRNDYSLAALRFVSAGKPKVVPLAMESYRREQVAGTVAMSRYEFLGCFDINGDGRMEIVLYSRQFEADGIQVFTFDGKMPRRVLKATWGV